MQDIFASLSERERRLVLGGGAIALVLILAQLIISPIANWRADRREAAAQAEGLFTIVSQAAAVAGDAAPTAPRAATPIRNALTSSAQTHGVSLSSFNVRDDGLVEANADLTDPASLFSWLAALEVEYGIKVTYADIAREQSDEARVRALLRFSRSGGSGSGA